MTTAISGLELDILVIILRVQSAITRLIRNLSLDQHLQTQPEQLSPLTHRLQL